LTLKNAKEDPMKNDQIPMWQRWAQFRFAVIGELLSSPPQKGQLQRAIERLSQQIYRHPIEADRRISLGASTIERWYYKAKGIITPKGKGLIVLKSYIPRFTRTGHNV
jgi:putative transposase